MHRQYIRRLNVSSTHTLAPSNTDENFEYLGNILHTQVSHTCTMIVRSDSAEYVTNSSHGHLQAAQSVNYIDYAAQSDMFLSSCHIISLIKKHGNSCCGGHENVEIWDTI